MRFSLLIFIVLLVSSCSPGKSDKHKSDGESPDTTSQISLPAGAIKVTYDGHIYFHLKIDSVEGDFLFDTGADQLYFDSLFYSENKFNHNKKVKAFLPGAGTARQSVEVVLDPVQAHLDSHQELVSSMTPIINLKEVVGDFADGIVGGQLLQDFILRISYDQEYIQLYSSIDEVDTVGYKKIPLQLRDGRYYLPLSVKIDDSLSIEGDFLLDLGSGGSVNLTKYTATQFGLDDHVKIKKAYYTRYGGLGGASSSFDFMAHSLSIGDFRFHDVVMSYSQDESGALSKGKYLGLLGNDVLERFDIIIDNLHPCLYLKPNSMYKKPFRFSKTGFSYVDRAETMGAWIVTGLFKDSNAEKVGLKIDDRIMEINGVDVKKINKSDNPFLHSDSVELIIDRKNNTDVKLKFALES